MENMIYSVAFNIEPTRGKTRLPHSIEQCGIYKSPHLRGGDSVCSLVTSLSGLKQVYCIQSLSLVLAKACDGIIIAQKSTTLPRPVLLYLQELSQN